MQMTAGQLCQMLNGELDGDPDIMVHKPSKIEEAEEGSLSFLANPKYEQFVYSTKASVLLVDKDFTPAMETSATLIRVPDVYQSLGILLDAFGSDEPLDKGVSELAFVHEDAVISDEASVGAFSWIGPDVRIGPGTRVYPHVFLGCGVTIGAQTKIFSGVKIYHHCRIGDQCTVHSNTVIGSDGFGFARSDNGVFSKIAQIGNVVLENGVEVGANCVIDRATMGSTVIRAGAKLDNLIQVAHNVDIGENTAVAAQAGFAGSTKIGRNVLIGGQAGFVGHITVADGVQVQAQSGIATSVEEEDSRIYGSPAIRYMDYLKSYSIFRKLPELQKKLEDLEKSIRNLEGDIE